MIIKSLYLENIRSYKSQKVFFSEGMTLLSGDIGSGKSTVLLGIEFALFGLIRGSISGSSLLRHGAKEGFVELEFVIGDDKFLVRRSLKRSSSGIVQDKCGFGVNNSFDNLTPVELKSKILSLLGYPEDLVTKSKTLIFRYTVYTPQEEMKQILFESKDDRLEKLRRIFGIDKYELIKNNASFYSRDLRSELRNYKIVRDEKSFLDEQLKNVRTELNLFFEEKDDLIKNNKKVLLEKKDVDDKKALLEKDISLFNELKSKRRVVVSEIQNLSKTLTDLGNDEKKLISTIKLKEDNLKEVPKISISLDDIQKEISLVDEKVKELDLKADDARRKDAIIKNKLKDIHDLLHDVNKLDNCPTCRQEVSDEHKKSLAIKEREREDLLKEKENRIKVVLEKISNNKKHYAEKKKSLDIKRDEVKELLFQKKLFNQNLKIINEKKEELNSLRDKKLGVEKKLKLKEKEELELNDELDSFKNLEDEIKKVKEQERSVQNKILDFERKKSSLERAIKEKESYIKEKERELEKKKLVLKDLDNKRVLEQWLSNHFVSLVGIIEKHVLSKIHREFNSLFREWFSMLVEDSELEASVDEDFSLSIVQNGYDSFVENLSGGEKTAVSLAYRLALNKVINDLIHDVKTKDFMILDEPTDGFSSDQLDNVRDVLERTNVRQIIIVSHEAKLESFVQNIIRVSKNNHVSEIL